MTNREAYIQHCATLGISRGLATLMAEQAVQYPYWHGNGIATRKETAASQLMYSLDWTYSEQRQDFWYGVYEMLKEMAKTGECK